MVPVLSACTINGIPVTELISKDKIDAIITRTAGGGGEIVKLMGTSAYYAPAAGAVVMAEAYLRDQKRILACAAYLNGEYGYTDLYMGVPVVIGGEGVEKIVTVSMSESEKAALDKSAEAVRGLITDSAKL
jgi:malate dehydrogenase